MVKKMKDAGQSETQLTIQALQCFFFSVENSSTVGLLTAVKLVFWSYDSKAIQVLYGTRQQ